MSLIQVLIEFLWDYEYWFRWHMLNYCFSYV